MTNTDLPEMIRKAIAAHGDWKLRLKSAINAGGGDLDAGTIACDDRCDLGRWLHGPAADAQMRSSTHYIAVRRMHADFHKAASDVARLIQKGDKAAAGAMLDGAFQDRSDRLRNEMSAWLSAARAQAGVPSR